MNFNKHAIILAVVDSLRRHGSWTGKTHVQKALSLLRDKGRIEVPFDFCLYRHGPYSFDVEAELEEMRSYGALNVEPNSQGYGVTLQTAEMADFVKQVVELSDDETKAIDDVCQFLGNQNVLELERLATASWIQCQEGVESSSEVARRLNQLKPHISIENAAQSHADVAAWLAQVDE